MILTGFKTTQHSSREGGGGEFSIAVHRVLHYDVKEKIALTLYILTLACIFSISYGMAEKSRSTIESFLNCCWSYPRYLHVWKRWPKAYEWRGLRLIQLLKKEEHFLLLFQRLTPFHSSFAHHYDSWSQAPLETRSAICRIPFCCLFSL